MAESDLSALVDVSKLTLHDRKSTEEEEAKNTTTSCTNNNNNDYKTVKCNAGEVEKVGYMSRDVAPEQKNEILSSEEKQFPCSGGLDVTTADIPETIVKNFVNDHLEKIVVEKYSSTTGLVYDARMQRYCATGYHPERPNRIRSMWERLLNEGLVDACAVVEPRFATDGELLTKHTQQHISFVHSVKDVTDQDKLDELAEDYNSIYFHPAVTDAALLAAGCTIALMEDILSGHLVNGAAIIRPPGHHALTHCSMGFCHFNNVAVAAQVAIDKFRLQRVLIVDWDVHYGNGTHKMFETDPRVMLFSMHRYDNGGFWPHDSEANYTAVGKERGEGYNIHVAWNESMMGDPEYMLAFDKLLMPIARQYNPELVIVSCGFDSGSGDPLGGCDVKPEGYANMTQRLMELAGGRVMLVLEGGYNLETISSSMAACVSTMLKRPVPRIAKGECKKSGVESVHNTFITMQKYWSALKDPKLVKYMDELLKKVSIVEKKHTRSSGSSPGEKRTTRSSIS